MGNRYGRKTTRKVKIETAAHKPGIGTFNWCRIAKSFVDELICIVRQERTPGDCHGCDFFGGSAA